jgi:hypothetical protein
MDGTDVQAIGTPILGLALFAAYGIWRLIQNWRGRR